MATYAVGDIQGCLDPLYRLLKKVAFNPKKDTLWVAGDLVNRGPDSLSTLRYLKSLGENARIVLGNHDLHLLAVSEGLREEKNGDTLKPILEAEDGPLLLNWLRRQPLLHYDKTLNFAMVHAGIPPNWSLKEARTYAKEVEALLRGKKYTKFLGKMYGDQPAKWDENLSGMARARLITNYLTRMRYCSAEGELELSKKTAPTVDSFSETDATTEYAPWFSFKNHRCISETKKGTKIIFGHWATLMGKTNKKKFIGLDTGCVWGGCLSALRLEDSEYYSVSCEN